MQQFNNTRHDFEIQLENASVVQPCEDEPQDSIPRALYHVRTLSFWQVLYSQFQDVHNDQQPTWKACSNIQTECWLKCKACLAGKLALNFSQQSV